MNHWHRMGRIGILVLSLSSAVVAQTATEIVTQLVDRFSNQPAHRAIYKQTTISPFSAAPLVETGWISQDGVKIRKDIQKPDAKIVIQTPEGSYTKILATGAVSSSAGMDGMGRRSMDLPSLQSSMDPNQMLKEINFLIKSETKDQWVLSGRYRSSDVEIVVSKTERLVNEIRVTDPKMNMNLVVKNTYSTVSGYPMLSKTEADVKLQLGDKPSTLKTTTIYTNIQVSPAFSAQFFDLEDPK